MKYEILHYANAHLGIRDKKFRTHSLKSLQLRTFDGQFADTVKFSSGRLHTYLLESSARASQRKYLKYIHSLVFF